MTAKIPTSDILIVGGGVIGLSLAYELAGHGAHVRLVDRGPLGREASWAGAGILPPAASQPQRDPFAELCRLSGQLYPIWSARLREETGLDNGFRRCGGVYLATDSIQEAELREFSAEWRAQGIRAEPLDGDGLVEREPALAASRQRFRAAWWLPDEAQVRNPRHLKALSLACARRGVELSPGVAVEGFRVAAGRVVEVITSAGRLSAGQICIASGPWSKSLLSGLGVEVPLRPVRGQMVLLSSPRPVLRSVINAGKQYLVPRPDGRILIGSTEEDAGFDKRTTAQAIGELLELAVRLAPPLGDLSMETCWAGLRPASHDELPYIGRVPGCDNLFLASGHFRNGLRLSPVTAVAMSGLMLDTDPGIDLTPFRVDRA
ncbi:MAG TPA: glycine oxidase ThiO [Pirellulales bacterium]|jgi:glycine oxidase|nr:glycine oxidase ThiO [Pirellulales bacterium]